MESTKKYSGLFIVAPEKQDAFDEVKSSISSVIGENSGDIVSDTVMGRKTLAYPIKKHKDAVYYEVIFMADPAAVPKMMRQFRINTDILRTLIDRSE
jgi:small subunit ribosomal protein S6